MSPDKILKRKRFKRKADERYKNGILSPLERRKKAIMGHQKLSKEKIEEVQQLIADGTKKADIIEQTGVSASTVDRIKNGTLTADGKIAPPAPDRSGPAVKFGQIFTAPESRADALPPRDVAILRSLTEQVLRALAGVEGATDADSHNLGQAYGLLTAVQLILGGGAE